MSSEVEELPVTEIGDLHYRVFWVKGVSDCRLLSLPEIPKLGEQHPKSANWICGRISCDPRINGTWLIKAEYNCWNPPDSSMALVRIIGAS